MGCFRRVIVAVVMIIFLRAVPGLAQGGSAALGGRVTDPSGLAVAGAKVQAVNTGTEVTSSSETNDVGLYNFPSLNPGTYQIVVEKEGFQRIVRPGVELHVAAVVAIDFALRVGAVAQTVTVEGGAPLVNTTTSSIGGLVESKEVEDLPLNGRNYIDLTLMQTGITASSNVVQSGSYSGTWFSSNGFTIRSNNFTIDGAIMQDLNNGSTANFSGRTLGIEGIQEYRVLTNNFSAEYGLVGGSQTIMVSKGGTNQFHGDAFEYLRNSVLDAANFFFVPVAANGFQRTPPYKRNNFGGSFGGPIQKDKTFFFATFEGLRERLGVSNLETVPGAGCHGAAGAMITNTACPQLGSTTASVTIPTTPYVAGLLSLFPLPNLLSTNQRTDPYTQPDGDNFGQIRVDHIFSDKDSAFARYTIDDDNIAGALPYPQFFVYNKLTRHQYLTLSENHIFNTSTLNTARVSYSRTASHRASPNNLGSQFDMVAGEGFGQLTIGQITTFAPAGPAPNTQIQSIITFSDDVAYTHGHHSFKFGTLINNYRQYGLNSVAAAGTLAFGSLTTFLQGKASNYTAVTPGSTIDRSYEFYTTGFYAQDEWRIRPRLTLNLGLRYEPAPNYYHEVHGISSTLRTLSASSLTVGPLFASNPTWHNISPRLGFAWDVFGNGKTAVRGGAGMYFDVANLGNAVFNFNLAQPPFSSKTTFTSPPSFTLPLSFTGTTPGNSLAIPEYQYGQPRIYEENFTIEQQLPFDMVLSTSYAGSRGEHLNGEGEGNPNVAQAFAANGYPIWPVLNNVRQNTAWGTIQYYTTNYDSTYNSLQVSLIKRFTHGLQFQSSFTWGKAIDDTQGNSGDSTSSAPFQADPYNTRYDRGLASFDIPKRWVFNVLYALPSTKLEGLLGGVTNGWSLGSIVTVQNGFPFNPVVTTNQSNSGINGGAAGNAGGFDRPNFNPAFTGPIILGTVQQYYNPAAFSLPLPFACPYNAALMCNTLGNVPRNFLIGPGLTDVDFSVRKDTKLKFLGEAGALQFRAEFFNIFNHPNLGMPLDTAFSGSSSTPLSNAGQISSTVTQTAERQIQFSLRLAF